MDEDSRYKLKYTLLSERMVAMEKMNEKLQHRIYHIKKQLRYMRSLKRIIIQRLLVYNDRFMELSLEIPDMEPGANIEDRVIDDVAECQRLKTPPASNNNTLLNMNNKRKRTENGSKPINNVSNVNRRHSTTKITGNEISRSIKSQDNRSSGSTNGIEGASHKQHVSCNAASVEEIVNSVILDSSKMSSQTAKPSPEQSAS